MAEIGLDDLAYRLRMDTAQFFDSRRREKRSVALVRGSPTASYDAIKDCMVLDTAVSYFALQRGQTMRSQSVLRFRMLNSRVILKQLAPGVRFADSVG